MREKLAKLADNAGAVGVYGEKGVDFFMKEKEMRNRGKRRMHNIKL